MQSNHNQQTFLRTIAILFLGIFLTGCVALTPIPAVTPGTTLPQPSAPATETDNPAALNQRQVLAMQLQLDLEEVQITNVEAMTWPDACLGVPNPAELCAAAETPGYRITLTANGEQYLYHTNQDGSQVRLADAPEPQIGETLIEWTGNGDSGCTVAQIGPDGIAIGRCYEEVRLGLPFAVESHATDLADFAATFASFTADTPAGSVTFNGSGAEETTPAQQRMIAEWAHLVQLEAQVGRGGASWGLAFAWHREGGIAGFCNDLTVYVSGEAWATSCRGQNPQDLGHFRLDAEQLLTLYNWVDTFQSFEYNQSDRAAADSMSVTLVFSGAGEQAATEADQAAIIDFAQTLYTAMPTDTSAAPVPVNDGAMSDTGEAIVETVEVRTLESSLVQVRAVLSGQLPDACAFVESTDVTVEGDTFYISMTVARHPNMRCAQMLTPFAQIVPLDTAGLAAGQYTVQAGEATATFVLNSK